LKTIKVLLRFPAAQTGKPVTSHLVRDYNLVFNILLAHVNPGMRGELTMELTGAEEDLRNGIAFLRGEHIEVVVVSRSIVWDAEACIHCGACTAVCPSGALALGPDDKLTFDEDQCVLCELCIRTCPLSVMTVNYTQD
jgi:ferredoxin